MKKYIIFLLLVVIFSPCVSESAPIKKFSFLENIFKHSTDVAKLGQKSKIVLKAAEKNALLAKYPRLAKSGDDVLKGILSIEKIMAKCPAAGRMIEKGVNPARVAIVANRSPDTIKAGENIANVFSAGKIKLDSQNLKNLPVPAVDALKKMDGNYGETANAFLTMTRRGGQKAVDVAERLLKYVNMKNAASVTALGLLAWHMQDPESCEQAVQNFFEEHVAPVMATPVKGVAKAAGKSLDEGLTSLSSNVGNLVMAHWYWLMLALIAIVFWKIPNARKLPYNFLNNMFGRINSRLENPMNNDHASVDKGKLSADTSRLHGNRVNVYKR